MWRPGNHQNPPKRDFCIILQISRNSAGNGYILGNLREMMVSEFFEVFGGPSRPDLESEQGIQRFREGSRNPENQ